MDSNNCVNIPVMPSPTTPTGMAATSVVATPTTPTDAGSKLYPAFGVLLTALFALV